MVKEIFSNKRLLQVVIALAALVPISAGIAGIFMGPEMILNDSSPNASLVSHFSYLSGLLLAIGLGYWSTLSDIEKQTSRFQLLSVLVFIGGLGRLYALIAHGVPDKPMLFGLIMELIVTPLLAVWQYTMARDKCL